MKVGTRFIRSIIDTAKTEETPMPWTRGAHRLDTIAARVAPHGALTVRTA